jgi:hypothetical protein
MRAEAAAYWLGHSEGFRVDSGGRRVGLVHEVVHGSKPERPDALVVTVGLLGRRLEVVPVEAVEGVEPRELRLQLRPSWRPSRSGVLTDLMTRLRTAAIDGLSGAALGLRAGIRHSRR